VNIMEEDEIYKCQEVANEKVRLEPVPKLL
jgi:hypothetical protein